MIHSSTSQIVLTKDRTKPQQFINWLFGDQSINKSDDARGECERQQPDQNKWTAKTSYFKVHSNFEMFESTRYFLQNKTKKVKKLKNWNFEHFFEISRSVSLVLNRDYGRRHSPAETRPGTPPDLMREKHVLYHEIRLIGENSYFVSFRHYLS